MGKTRDDFKKNQIEQGIDPDILTKIGRRVGRPSKKIVMSHSEDNNPEYLRLELLGLILDALRGNKIGDMEPLGSTAWYKMVELVIDRQIIPLGVNKDDITKTNVKKQEIKEMKDIFGINLV
jgi:hypothetical protein